jgi:hypothetical protein
MTTTIVKRQIIRDADDNPIAVILPIEEFVLVEDLLDKQSRTKDDAEKLAKMKQAAEDPLFLADLRDTMTAFADADAEWWERTQ